MSHPCRCLALALALLPWTLHARTPRRPRASTPPPLYVSLIDQLAGQGAGPAVNGLDERRRGPIFNAALQQVVRAGKLPPVVVINQDLSLPGTTADEPTVPAGTELVRVYLTQWSLTRLGGPLDAEILCRFFVERRRDGRTYRKLGPFFARQPYDPAVANGTAEERWAQFQAAARKSIEQMAAALNAPDPKLSSR